MRKTVMGVCVALLASSAWVHAATPTQKTAVATPITRGKTSQAKKTPSGGQKAVLSPSRALPAAAMVPAAIALGQEEINIAQNVHQGQLPCELGASVRVESDHKQPGYFNVMGKGFHFHMHPVATSTGAIRLEDKKAGAVWLQLANKSMLMDGKKGQRLADECAHPEQVAFAQRMKTNPLPALIDTSSPSR